MASNSGDTGIKALLDSLQALYAKMSALIINKRINSYRKEGGAQLDTEILSALYDIVEKTPAAQSPGLIMVMAGPQRRRRGRAPGSRTDLRRSDSPVPHPRHSTVIYPITCIRIYPKPLTLNIWVRNSRLQPGIISTPL